MKMKRLLVGLVLLLAVLAPKTTWAATEAGKFEFSAALNLSIGTGSDSAKQLMVLFGGGYFMTPALELKATAVGAWSWQNSGDSGMMGILFGPDYHFNTTGKFVPYVGVYGGAFFAQRDNSDQTVGTIYPHVGIKHFVSERWSINYEVGYQHYFTEISNNSGNVVATIGISTYF